MDELISIASGQLTARISARGAELRSLCDAAGREYLIDAEAGALFGHAPLLFPIIMALRHGCYRIGGREWPLGVHGFAGSSGFDLADHGPDHARFILTDSPETMAVYPFRFVLAVSFRVEEDVLKLEATVANRGEEPLWFSFGFHPAFAWPLPGGAAKEDHRIIFAEEESGPVRRVDAANLLMLPERFDSPVKGRVLAPRAELFEAGAMIFERLASRSLSFGAEGGSRVEMTMPDTGMLGLWQMPGADFLCIEPWQGLSDPIDWEGDFRFKPGVVELDAGASRAFRMDLRVIPG